MAASESSEITSREGTKESNSNPKNPFLSLIPKFPFGFMNQGGEGGKADAVNKKESSLSSGEVKVEEERFNTSANVVTFRRDREPQLEPLKIESDCAGQNSHPLILLQIYALGGFILMKWAWAKWQERQADAKKRESEDDDKEGDSTEDKSPSND